MTKKEVKESLPILQAYIDGKTIQYYDYIDEEWKDIQGPSLSLSMHKYRIKPKIKYTPFANGKECLKEMKKHEPFGWIFDEDDEPCSIISARDGSVCTIGINSKITPYKYDFAFEYFKFLDGSTFGKTVEQ